MVAAPKRHGLEPRELSAQRFTWTRAGGSLGEYDHQEMSGAAVDLRDWLSKDQKDKPQNRITTNALSCVCPDSSDIVQVTNNIFIKMCIILEHIRCTVSEKE